MPITTPGEPARIDVLIPAYNVATTIVQAVESILRQTVVNLHIVVVDDGSTDGTGTELARLASRDPRVVVMHQSNAGIVDALNNGLHLCKSEFVARHDGDDIAYPDRLAKQLAYLDANPDCIAVASNARHIDGAGNSLGKYTNSGDPAHADVNQFPAFEPYLMHPLLMIRRDALVSIGAYRHAFHAEDADLYWRLRAIGRLHNMPDVLADYRIHADSVTGRSVVNGRIQAVNSQLAALSEKRRQRGAPDLTFSKSKLARFEGARSMGGIMAVAEEDLGGAEIEPFRLAVAAKLLELESYRPYRLEQEDRDFAKQAIVSYRKYLDKNNEYALQKRQGKYIIRLMSRGEFAAAATLIRPSLVWPSVVVCWELVKRRLFPTQQP